MTRTNCCGAGTSFESKRWLSLDPCGVFGVLLSWGVHIYALLVIPTHLLDHSLIATIIFYALYLPVAALALSSLFMASTTDPGAVPLGAKPFTTVRRAESLGGLENDSTPSIRRGVRRCHKCQDNYKPPRAHHDSVTGRCIVKFDHFCPWVGNAVGAMNHKFFCLFLLYTSITCILSLLLLILRVVHCRLVVEQEEARDVHDKATGDAESGARMLESHYADSSCDNFYASNLVMGLFVVSLIFLIFSCSMGFEQLEAVQTGKGKIARMKMSVGNTGTEFSTVTEEFNEMFGGESPEPALHWFLPVAVKFPRGMKKVVLGYDWDESMVLPYQEESESSSNEQELDEMENGRVKAPPLPGRAAVSRTASDMSVDSVSGRVKNRRPNGSRSAEDSRGSIV